MSKSSLRELLSKALILSAITKELGQCCCANLKHKNKGGFSANQGKVLNATGARIDCDHNNFLTSRCVGGVCEVTWKPVSHAA
jgi:hypothetical protein